MLPLSGHYCATIVPLWGHNIAIVLQLNGHYVPPLGHYQSTINSLSIQSMNL